MKYAHIVGWGKYAPQRVLTNDDIARLVETSDGWIRERTGIGERHIAEVHETTASLAIEAAVRALDVAGIPAYQLDLIIVATCTPEHTFPSTACVVQDALGADHAAAFDLSAACSGFVYALSVGADAIRAGSAKYALVIGSETMSRLVNWKDRNTCVLFGDGAGAVVLQSSDQPGGVLTTLLRADGSGGDLLMVPAGGSKHPLTEQALALHENTIQMNGREVFRFASRVIDRSLRDMMRKTGWTSDEIDVIVPHQANIRIIEAASRSLGIPLEKFYCNIEHYGNTSAASIPIALAEAAENGRLKSDDKVVMVGFGGGLTWGAAAVQWGQPPAPKRSHYTLSRVGYGLAGARSRARRLIRRVEDRLFGRLDPAMRPPPSAPAPAPTPTREIPGRHSANGASGSNGAREVIKPAAAPEKTPASEDKTTVS
jgi:3-oxoacyl-[acyl-carrier-protein] synthase-3